MSSFTLIELLIVVAIIGIVGATVIILPPGLQQTANLDAATQTVVSALLEARAKTLASESDYPYGVHLEPNRVVVFKGLVYNPSNLDNELTLLSASVTITAISLSGNGSEVIFNRLKGDTNQDGVVTLGLVSDLTRKRVITVTKTGLVYSAAL